MGNRYDATARPRAGVKAAFSAVLLILLCACARTDGTAVTRDGLPKKGPDWDTVCRYDPVTGTRECLKNHNGRMIKMNPGKARMKIGTAKTAKQEYGW